jgi:hypothetical protein
MGRRRKKRSRRDYRRRSRRFNRHHLINRCRGGNASEQNILIMDTNRHAAWHLLFRNSDFVQVARLLLRCYEMKTKKSYQIVEI